MLVKRTVSLNAIDKVKEFVNLTSATDATELDVDLVSGRYVIDAKSIMGIFSLDLSKPIDLHVHAEFEEDATPYLKSIAKFLVD